MTAAATPPASPPATSCVARLSSSNSSSIVAPLLQLLLPLQPLLLRDPVAFVSSSATESLALPQSKGSSRTFLAPSYTEKWMAWKGTFMICRRATGKGERGVTA